MFLLCSNMFTKNYVIWHIPTFQMVGISRIRMSVDRPARDQTGQ